MAATFDIKAYRESLKTKYNIPDEDLAPFEKDITSTSEFSRYQTEHKKAMADVEQERKQLIAQHAQLSEYETWVKGLETEYGPREQWSAAFKARIGNSNPDGSGTVNTGVSATDLQKAIDTALIRQRTELTADFNKQIEQVGQGAASFARFYYQANKHWEKEYGTELPEEEFRKFYEDNGHVDPRIALKLYEQPFAEKKREAEYEKKIAEAELRGEQRARSQAGIMETGVSAGGWFSNADRVSIGVAGSGVDLKSDDGGDDRQASQAQFAARMAKVGAGAPGDVAAVPAPVK